jgi:hypothetical protein
MLSFIEDRVVNMFLTRHPMAKNDPVMHKPYTLGVLCVLRGDLSTTAITEIAETKDNVIFH